MKSFCVLGKILRPHGISGALKIRLYSDDPQNLFKYSLFLSHLPDFPSSGPHKLSRVFNHLCDTCSIKLEGLDSRNGAEGIRDSYLLVPRAELPPLPDGEYYWHDLIGCDVYDTSGASRGKIASVSNQGGGDVARLASPASLLLLTEDWVERIELESRCLVVKKEFWS